MQGREHVHVRNNIAYQESWSGVCMVLGLITNSAGQEFVFGFGIT